jgi:hypothetical protein
MRWIDFQGPRLMKCTDFNTVRLRMASERRRASGSKLGEKMLCESHFTGLNQWLFIERDTNRSTEEFDHLVSSYSESIYLDRAFHAQDIPRSITSPSWKYQFITTPSSLWVSLFWRKTSSNAVIFSISAMHSLGRRNLVTFHVFVLLWSNSMMVF